MKNYRAVTLIVCLFIVAYVIANSFYLSYQNYNHQYNFLITKIGTNEKQNLIFFDRNKTVMFSEFSIPNTADIKVGDSVSKPKCSKFLYLYRKDKDNHYKKQNQFHAVSQFDFVTVCKEE